MIAVLLAKKIVQLFIVMLLGFIIVKAGILKSEDSKVLSKLCIYLLIPFVIIDSFQMEFTPDIMKGVVYAAVMSAVIHTIQITISALGGKLVRLDTVEQASVSYSNTVNLIIPLVTAILGSEWIIFSSTVASVQLVFIWSLGVSSFAGWKNMSAKKMLLNVNMLSVLGGFVLLLTGFRFPEIINNVASSMGSMVGNFAMLIVGMLLAETDLKEMLKRKRIYLVIFLRMLFCPVICLALVKLTDPAGLFAGGYEIGLAILLAAAAPTATTITQFAQLYGKDAKYAGAINITTTLVCIITMPLFVYLYELF